MDFLTLLFTLDSNIILMIFLTYVDKNSTFYQDKTSDYGFSLKNRNSKNKNYNTKNYY